MPKSSLGNKSIVPFSGVDNTGFPHAKYSKILIGIILSVILFISNEFTQILAKEINFGISC
jgi:hypothetical protein